MRKEDIIVPGRVYAVEEMERLLAVREERRAAEQRAAELKAVRDSSIHHALRDLLREAFTAQPLRAHTPNGSTEPTGYFPAPMKRSMVVPLRTTNLVGLFDKNGKVTHTPAGALAGEVVPLSGAIIANSRVAWAGAHVILRPEGTSTFQGGKSTDVVAFESRPNRFVTVDDAPFTTVAEDEEAPLSTLPIHAVDLTAAWAGATTKAFRVELNRSDFNRASSDEILSELMTAVALGLARAADAVLLSAVKYADGVYLRRFSTGSLAKRGVRIGDVRALIGERGDGAGIGADGKLRAALPRFGGGGSYSEDAALAVLGSNGVLAEFTPDVADTFAGVWSRSAVVISDEVTIVFERINKNGRLSVSVWSTMLPVIPDPSVFFTFRDFGSSASYTSL